MEPKLGQADPAIPASWPVGSPELSQAEASLPAITYQQIFTDPRVQTLIAQALVNNRDLMVAAANIAAAREQYVIQRAQQFPQLDATAGATVTGNRSGSGSSDGSGSGSGSGTGGGSSSKVTAQYQAGLQVPSFELDLFGRLRSLTHSQLEQYFATEAGARATRLTLVANIANAWLGYAADSSLLLVSQQTVDTAQKSVRLTRLRLEGGIAPRTDLSLLLFSHQPVDPAKKGGRWPRPGLEGGTAPRPDPTQAEEFLSRAGATLARRRIWVARDVTALQLLGGGPIDPPLLPASID